MRNVNFLNTVRLISLTTFTILLFLPVFLSQDSCTITFHKSVIAGLSEEKQQLQKWVINGQAIQYTTVKVSVATNYPDLDTIVYFSPRNYQKTTITKFRINEIYNIGIGCCEEGYNIHLKSERDLFKTINHKEIDSILDLKLNQVKVQFSLFNAQAKDTILVHTGIFMAFSPVSDENILTYRNKTSALLIPEYFESYPGEFPVFIMNSKQEIIQKFNIKFFDPTFLIVIYDKSENNLRVTTAPI